MESHEMQGGREAIECHRSAIVSGIHKAATIVFHDVPSTDVALRNHFFQSADLVVASNKVRWTQKYSVLHSRHEIPSPFAAFRLEPPGMSDNHCIYPA